MSLVEVMVIKMTEITRNMVRKVRKESALDLYTGLKHKEWWGEEVLSDKEIQLLITLEAYFDFTEDDAIPF